MGTIVSVYSKNAFRECILPAVDNTDYDLTLGRRYFNTENDQKIHMEVLAGKWYIKASDDYTIHGLTLEYGRYRFLNDHIVSVTDRDDEDFRLIARAVPSLFHSFVKIDITDHERISIGRASDNDICYDSLGLVSKYHAMMIHDESGWMIQNQSKNGIYVNSQRIKGDCQLVYGSFINIFGLHIIYLGDLIAIDDTQANVALNPLLRPYSKKSGGSVKDENEMYEPFSGIHYSDKKSMLDYSRITLEQPVLGVNRWKTIYDEYLDKKEHEIRTLNEKNRNAMLAMFPSSIDLMAESAGTTCLWDRSTAGEGLLRVRIGTGEVPSVNDISLEEGKLYLTDRELYERATAILRKYKTISDVPFTVDLDSMNSVCISADDPERSLLIAENICVQLAQHISPANLRMAFISDEEPDDQRSWKEARWLPHTWSEDMSCRYYANDKAETAEAVYRLSRILISREELNDEEIADLPRYVVFVSDLNDISGTVIQKYVTGRRWLGFTLIYISDGKARSAAANGVVIEEKDGRGIVYGNGTAEGQEFSPDDFDHTLFDRFTRKLAAVRNDISDGIAIIPDFVTLFDTMGIDSAKELNIRDCWAKNRTYDHLQGMLGKGAGNMVRTLDLHERYHGPHALIAGTTGSGKSELLQSYVVSLAAEYSPDDLNFVLVDFKGGGMANTLVGLPHISGLITNLSGGEIRRAVLAVKNEIVRRQTVLNDYGINHIDDYVKLYKSGEVSEPIPHLMIIVDEFAELKKEKPEFMKDLISVAQTGRSLGIHLVLATQRPRGNVDDDIRSNMRSAVCLRVQDRKDSMDVLDRPDAAYLTGAGRGYLEVGAGEIFEPFQAAFSGRSRMSTGKDTGRMLMLTDDGRADVVSTFEEREEMVSDSQLDQIKAEIIHIADGISVHAVDLWLPELRHVIRTADIKNADRRRQNRSDSFAIGLVDDPEDRLQYPLMLDFPGSGNIAIVGTPSSGKTTAVRTLLDQISALTGDNELTGSYDVPDVYGIDLDSGMMEEFESRSFVKHIVTGQDVLGIEELLDDLGDITEKRKAAGSAERAAVVLIDSYEDFRNTAGYKCETKLAELMREGPGVGISYVITGGGFGLGQISGSAERNIRTVLSLQQRNRYEYMDTLHTSDIETIPEEDIKGRGLTVIRGKVLEFQIALSR